MQILLNEFVNFVVETCNGKRLKHEETGFKEIAIFKTGVTL
jgi:altronate hydrolase